MLLPGASSLLWLVANLTPPPIEPRRVTDTTAASNPYIQKEGMSLCPTSAIDGLGKLLKLSTCRPSEKGCGPQSGECTQPFTLHTPD